MAPLLRKLKAFFRRSREPSPRSPVPPVPSPDPPAALPAAPAPASSPVPLAALPDAPAQPADAPDASPEFPTAAKIPLGQRLQEAALLQLSKKQKDSLCIDESEPGDITTAIRKAHDAALEKKKVCEEKRWIGTEKATKILNCINMFKPIADAVAGIDPIHVKLPWTAVNALLIVVTADNTQMTALLDGMDLSLSMIARLDAYVQYHDQLRPDLTTDNLERAMVEIYVHLLKFLALGMSLFSQKAVIRAVQALWQASDLERFDSKCRELGKAADIEANNCDRLLAQHDRKLAKEAKARLDKILDKLESIDIIGKSIEKVDAKLDLKGLKIAKGATHNSNDEQHNARCLEGTRVELLDQITTWSQDPCGEKIFWLCGMAGTGKSTIARTVAQRLNDSNRLGASFFFKRGEGDRGKAGRFFPTIVKQLADKRPDTKPAIASALEKDSVLWDRQLEQQFNELLVQPFSSQKHDELFLVVDALDECENSDNIGEILRLLTQKRSIDAVNLRIFVSSRPELPMETGFQTAEFISHKDVILETVQVSTIARDIPTYFHYQFQQIRSKAKYDTLPGIWPDNEDIAQLVNLAGPLFIYAFMVCGYVSERTPQKRLQEILREGPLLSGFAKIYLPILRRMVDRDDVNNPQEILDDFKAIVGAIVLLAEPLSVASLSSLISTPREQVWDILHRLKATLSAQGDEPVRIFHQSFRDFLLDTTKIGGIGAQDFHVDEVKTHDMLATNCIRRLETGAELRPDICDLQKSGVRRYDVDQQIIKDALPSEVAYACVYWVFHIEKSGTKLRDNDQVHGFLRRHLLHWLEALCWLDRSYETVSFIERLTSCVEVKDGIAISAFLNDARRFVVTSILDTNPLQLYHSLVFSLTCSIIRDTFQEEIYTQFRDRPSAGEGWSHAITALQMHIVHSGECVLVSLDGMLTGLEFLERSITMWDPESRALQAKHVLGQDIDSLTIFADSRIQTASSEGRTIQMWNSVTGVETTGTSMSRTTMRPALNTSEAPSTNTRLIRFVRQNNNTYMCYVFSDGPVRSFDVDFGLPHFTLNLPRSQQRRL